MRNKRLILIVICGILLFGCFQSLVALSQTTTSDSTAQQTDAKQVDPSLLTSIRDIKSLWDITLLAGFWRWIIIADFILGMMTILYKGTELTLDKQRARELERLRLKKVTLVDVMRVIKNNKNSMLSQLFKQMLDLYQTRRSAEGFSDEIVDFVQIQQDRFQTFQAKMAFFSDTAGALGLLGTVWGMFLTFFGGDLEKHKILSGMGVALVTTLMGLVVSVFLNLFTTQTYSFFRKRIDKVTDLGNEFRLRLHQMEQTLDNSFPDDEIESNLQPNQQTYELSEAVIAAVDRQLKQTEPIFDITEPIKTNNNNGNNDYRIIRISGDNQSVQVNSRLEKPLIVQISNGNGNGIANKSLIFEVAQGDGKLANGRKQHEVLSDASGLAQTDLILGSTAGENRVRVRLKDSENSAIHFNAWGKPTEPDRVIYVAGNHQNSHSGKELKEPFMLKVIDKFDNPIPECPVTFKVIKGKGYFPEKKSIFLTNTDDNGIAEAYFTLGNKPGFNSVQATAKGVRKTKLEFEALGQG
jgi:biopolymer transport protein ExbB/TolQ